MTSCSSTTVRTGDSDDSSRPEVTVKHAHRVTICAISPYRRVRDSRAVDSDDVWPHLVKVYEWLDEDE
jgi:hypothetical protein